jgi:type IX secretion system PorP/SprF family membrane protein
MVNMRKKGLIASVILTFQLASLAAQDIHFSQFNRFDPALNPAMTGQFPADVRLSGIRRSQWRSVPVPFVSSAVAFDTRAVHPLTGENNQWGWGFSWQQDEAGDGRLRLTSLSSNLSLTRPLSSRLQAGIGFQVSAGQRSLQTERLTFESQWNGDVFDPDASNAEPTNASSRGIFSLGSGLQIHYKSENRTNFRAGIGAFHLNKPRTSFIDQPDIRIFTRLTNHLQAEVQLSANTDVCIQSMISQQGKYREILNGLGLRRHLSLEERKAAYVQAGLFIRYGDALIPAVEMRYRNCIAGMSYDINTSGFRAATGRRGGPEVFVQWLLFKVHPPAVFKSCPIF